MVVMSLHQHLGHRQLSKWWISHHRIHTNKMGVLVPNRPNTNSTGGPMQARTLNNNKRVLLHHKGSLSTLTRAW